MAGILPIRRKTQNNQLIYVGKRKKIHFSVKASGGEMDKYNHIVLCLMTKLKIHCTIS